MIQINCTNCKSLLQIDDAFAGGVCRCRHCGTIQTVPKRLKATSAVGASDAITPISEESESKSLGGKRALPETIGSGTGLDDLAGIVASSGLTSSRLHKKAAPAETPKPAPPAWDHKILAIVASAAALIAILLGVIIFLAVRDGSSDTGETPVLVNTTGSGKSSSNGTPAAGGTNTTPPAALKLANFFGETIAEHKVVYVIDRGYSSNEGGRLDLVKPALIRSLNSLGPDRQFQIVFWSAEKDELLSWPANGMELATPANIAKAQTFVDDVYPYGATEVPAALTKALKSKPELVVLLPIKSLPGNQEAFASTVLDLRRSTAPDAKFYCFSLEQPDWAPSLDRIGGVTGGFHKSVTLDKLRQYAGQ